MSNPLSRGWEQHVIQAVPWLILGYFALHVVLRVTAPGGLGLDEAEQIVTAQSLEWGYGAQPPLYTWLQWLVFRVTGEGKLGLALLKNALLAVAYLTVWRAVLRVTEPRTAAVAALSLLLLPAVAWEAQRALTHSVLSVTLAVLMLWLLLGRGPFDWGKAVLFGLLAGLALLAKYNTAFLIGGLVIALLYDGRAAYRLVASVGVAAVVLAGHVLWLWRHPDIASTSADKFGADGPGFLAAGWGVLSLVTAVVSFAGLLLAVHAALFWWRKPMMMAPPRRPKEVGFLGVGAVGAVLLVLAAVLLTGATEVKERWLQPVLIGLPIALALAVRRQLVPPALRAFLLLTGGIALVVLVMLQVNLRIGGGNPSYQSAPLAEAAAALPDGPRRVAVADDYLAGNLRYLRPELAVVTPAKPQTRPDGPPDLVAWWKRDGERPVPPSLAELVRRRGGPEIGGMAVQSRTFPYPAPHGERTFTLHWIDLR